MADRWLLAACFTVCLCQTAASFDGSFMGDSAAWFKRSTSSQFSRRFVLEELQPVPAHSTCRLQWHSAAPAAFGTTALPQRCSASDDSCLACASGFEHVQGTGICLQKCPHESVGPAHMCAVSRTCVRGDSVCPMVATEILFLCTAANQLLGSCAKQSYQAVLATKDVNVTCENGLVLQAYSGDWRCVSAPDSSPCSPGFSSAEELQGSIGARCKQVCPPWLVDCGDTCNMPGVPCSTRTEQLCPVVPLTACDLEQRTSSALQTACQSLGMKGTGGSCPLALTMHGSCGGAKLQVAVGLRTQGFVRSIEGWWGPVTNGQQPLSADGPLTAVRVTFTGDKDPVVFGNASHAAWVSPRVSFSLDASELVVSSSLWSSTTVMEGSSLTPVLAGFNVFTMLRNLRVVGAEGITGGSGADSAAAKQTWQQRVELSGSDLGVGLPVGAAAFASDSAIHSFGLLYLSKVAKQEL